LDGLEKSPAKAFLLVGQGRPGSEKPQLNLGFFVFLFLFYVLVVFTTLLNIFPQESWLIIVIIYDHLLVGHLKANGVVFRMHTSIKLSSMEMYPPLISYVIYMLVNLCEHIISNNLESKAHLTHLK